MLGAAEGTFASVGAGGGTLTGDVTMVLNAGIAAGVVTDSIKSSGANVKTIIPGDRMTLTEGVLTESVTFAAQATMNGVAAVTVLHSPTANAYTVAAVLTFQAATGKAICILPAAAAVVGATLDIWVLAAGDVTTVTGGALTASQPYDLTMNEAFHASAAVDLVKLS